MNALLQRLKELDPSTFETLCFQICSERLPGVEVRHVEGKAGDKGIDLFAGTLASGPAVWQCKFFPDGIKDSQKKQIKKSLKTVLKHFKPSLWTLCVPVDLDINASSWFQKLIASHATKVKIELFDASLIVKELVFRTPILNAFFPGAVLDVEEIKSVLLRTGDYSDNQLGKLADETVEQYIERLRKQEPRYDYQLSYLSGSRGAESTGLSGQNLPPNTMMSMRQGNRRLDLVVRDVEALRKDPPRITVSVSLKGITKIHQAMQSGSQVELGQGELLKFRSSFDFLMPPDQVGPPAKLLVTPTFLKTRESFRVSFLSGNDHVVYDLIEFDVTRKQRELHFASVSEHIPFQMLLSVRLDGTASNFEVTSRFYGYDILEVQKFFKAFRLIKVGGELSLFDLKTQKAMGPMPVELTSTTEDPGELERLTDQFAEVATSFGQRLRTPEVINEKDLETLALLLEVSRRGEITGATVENLKANLVRCEGSTDRVFELLKGDFTIGLESENYPVQSLLGAQISVGAWRTIIEKASLLDFENVKKKYEVLEPGQSIPVKFTCNGSVRQIFTRFYKGEAPYPTVTL